MRWLGNFVGEEQVIRKFAFLPIKANGEWRWLEFVCRKIHSQKVNIVLDIFRQAWYHNNKKVNNSRQRGVLI